MRMVGVLGVTLFLLAIPVGAHAYDRLVNPFHSCSLSGTPEHETLQDAVDAASPGDHIGVCPGIYDQTVIVTTPVTLTAIGSVVISPSAFNIACFDIEADNVTVRYFVIQGPCLLGIRAGTSGAVIQNNHLKSLTIGIVVEGPNNIVQNNLIEDAGEGIVAAVNPVGTTIKNNTLRRVDVGIFLEGNGVIVNKNSVQNSIFGLGTSSDAADSTISFNTMSFNVVGMILVDLGLNNQVIRNVVTRNTLIDCIWDGTGAATFSRNTCGTESPAGVWD
jgi:hypothetical protein